MKGVAIANWLQALGCFLMLAGLLAPQPHHNRLLSWIGILSGIACFLAALVVVLVQLVVELDRLRVK